MVGCLAPDTVGPRRRRGAAEMALPAVDIVLAEVLQIGGQVGKDQAVTVDRVRDGARLARVERVFATFYAMPGE